MDERTPFVRNDDDVDYREVGGANGLRRADLISEADGAPNFELRKYVVEPGVEVGRHRNTIEHEQYVLAGEYTIGIGDEEFRISSGHSVFIPAGTVHWYRNETDVPAKYLCIVPIGDEGTEFLE
jgi:quercetin dioxygenase-like cupin family protein